MDLADRYYPYQLAAFIRGRLGTAYPDHPQFTCELGDLDEAGLQALLALGQQHELSLHKFKRKDGPPRVQRCLGLLHGLQIHTLLDIGSGRGAFLWPLIDQFPHIDVTCLDILPHRIRDIEAMAQGGWTGLQAREADITGSGYEDDAFDFVCMLEVLEHIPACEQALAEACRIARTGVLLSVPSKPDDNPEHIHLFTKDRLTAMFAANGIDRIRFHSVTNHFIVLALKHP